MTPQGTAATLVSTGSASDRCEPVCNGHADTLADTWVCGLIFHLRTLELYA